MTDKIVILVTTASRDEAKRIARHLVEARLAACVNIVQSIESVYRWEGQITEDVEFLLIIKSVRGLFPEIRNEIAQLHSYQTPEVICVPILDGSPHYLEWLAASVKASEAEKP